MKVQGMTSYVQGIEPDIDSVIDRRGIYACWHKLC
jgi:hypothetical protein